MLENVKKDGELYAWTPEEMKELKKCIDDKLYFFEKYLKIDHPTHGLVPMTLKRSQHKMFEQFERNNKTICVAPKQTGTTTYMAADAIHTLLFYPHQAAVYGASKLNQSKSFMDMVRCMIKKLPDCLSSMVLTSNKAEISLNNGSRLIAMAINKNFGNGFNLTHLYFDNTIWVSKNSLDGLYDVISTFIQRPNIKVRFVDTCVRDYFAQMQKFLDDDDYTKFNILTTDDERFDDEEYAANIIDSIGKSAYHEEYAAHWAFR